MTTTKAMPLSAGMAAKKPCSAAMLPAEPPRPTIGSIAYERLGTASSTTSASASSAWSGAGCEARLFGGAGDGRSGERGAFGSSMG